LGIFSLLGFVKIAIKNIQKMNYTVTKGKIKNV